MCLRADLDGTENLTPHRDSTQPLASRYTDWAIPAAELNVCHYPLRVTLLIWSNPAFRQEVVTRGTATLKREISFHCVCWMSQTHPLRLQNRNKEMQCVRIPVPTACNYKHYLGMRSVRYILTATSCSLGLFRQIAGCWPHPSVRQMQVAAVQQIHREHSVRFLARPFNIVLPLTMNIHSHKMVSSSVN